MNSTSTRGSSLSRRSFLATTLISATALGTVPLSGRPHSTSAVSAIQDSDEPTGQIAVGESAFWEDLNPLTLSDAKGLDLFITEPLVIYSRDDWSQMLPGLAESWSISEDGLRYTFQLRAASYSDGQPFSADDVLYTFETAMLPETGYSGPVPLSSIESIEATGDREVTIALSSVSAVFLQTLSRFGMVAKHLLEGQDLATTEYRQFPIGTGPFVVKEHNAEFFTLEANSNYWGAPPGVQQIVFKTAPDAAARSAMLRSGDIDLSRYEPHTQAGLDGNGYHIDTTQSLGWLSCEVNHRNPLFAEKRVRQAMLFALNRPGLLNIVNPGMASPASGPLVPDDPYYEGEVQQYEHDLEQAASLMKAAGWTRNDDGFWEKDGEVFSFTLMAYQPNPVIYNTNLALEESWQTFGFDVSVDVAPDWPSWWDRYIAGDFDAGVMDWAYGPDPDGMSGNFESGGGLNGSGYSNADVDELFVSGRTSVDEADRKEAYAQIQQILVEDLPTLWLAWQDRGIIMRDGIEATYNPIGDFYANAYWWTISG